MQLVQPPPGGCTSTCRDRERRRGGASWARRALESSLVVRRGVSCHAHQRCVEQHLVAQRDTGEQCEPVTRAAPYWRGQGGRLKCRGSVGGRVGVRPASVVSGRKQGELLHGRPTAAAAAECQGANRRAKQKDPRRLTAHVAQAAIAGEPGAYEAAQCRPNKHEGQWVWQAQGSERYA